MKKFSFAYVKKNPVMFGTIFVVFGLLLYLMLNRGSDGGGGGVPSYISTGPTDAEIAGQVQLGQASIAAGAANTQANIQLAAIASQNQAQLAALTQQGQTDIALATLASKIQLEGLAVDRELSNKSIDATLAAQMAQFGTTLAMQQDNNASSLAAQRDQNATQLAFFQDSNATMLENTRINASLQATLGQQQSDAYKVSSVLSVIPTLKKKDRDQALVAIVGGGDYRGAANNGSPLLSVSPTVSAA